MHRKILGICAALVALGAFAVVPSLASAANVTLEQTEGGVTVPVTKPIVADTDPGTTALFEGSFGKTECNENVMTGSIAKNNGTEVRGTIERAWFQSNLTTSATKCASTLGAVTVTIPALTNEGGKGHWCIRTVPGEDRWELWGNGCETEPGGELTFVLDFASMTCSYKRSGSVTGEYTTTASTHEAATLELKDEPEFVTDTSSSIFCPANGKLKVFKFKLYTDADATGVNGDFHEFGAQPTANPVFFNPVS